MKTLGALGRTSVEGLRAAIDDARGPVRLRAVETLATLDRAALPAADALRGLIRRDTESIRLRLAAAVALCGAGQANRVPSALMNGGFLDCARHEDPALRRAAITCLATLTAPSEAVVLAICTGLDDGDRIVRWRSLKAMCDFGQRAVPALRGALAAKDARVRDAAVAGCKAIAARVPAARALLDAHERR